jgi:hypothetical protein
MATFVPQFAHDTLLKLAEAAYLQNLNPATDLPAGYVVAGQITANPAVAAQLGTMMDSGSIQPCYPRRSALRIRKNAYHRNELPRGRLREISQQRSQRPQRGSGGDG